MGYDERIRVYPTLRCNAQCGYCANWREGQKRIVDETAELEPTQWFTALNRIGRDVIITGGEPFMYNRIHTLVNGIKSDIAVWIYSNLMAPKFEDRLGKFKRKVSLMVTYHVAAGDPKEFIRRLGVIENVIGLRCKPHCVRGMVPVETVKLFADAGYQLSPEPNLRDMFAGSQMKTPKAVRCTRRILLIGPDGNQYPCVGHLVRSKDPVCSILDEMPSPDVTTLCSDYGHCGPCDWLAEGEAVPCGQ